MAGRYCCSEFERSVDCDVKYYKLEDDKISAIKNLIGICFEAEIASPF